MLFGAVVLIEHWFNYINKADADSIMPVTGHVFNVCYTSHAYDQSTDGLIGPSLVQKTGGKRTIDQWDVFIPDPHITKTGTGSYGYYVVL